MIAIVTKRLQTVTSLLESISDDTTWRSMRLFFYLDGGQAFNVVDIGHCHKPRASI